MKAIEAKGLVKRYVVYERRGFFKRRRVYVEALRGVTFSVDEGTIYGLLGPNGAGKTTTIKILSTLLLPDGGEARVGGFDVVSEADKVREVIGVTLSVERGFFWKLTGRENLKYFGMLRGLSGSELDKRIDYLVRLVGLDELGAVDKLYEEYSMGMRARLSLARALLADPQVLMLDEPTLGLDPPSARTIRELLVRLAREEGKTVLITTHNMHEAEVVSDRLAIINEGKIIAEGTVPELKALVAKSVSVMVTARVPPLVSVAELAERLRGHLERDELSVEPAGEKVKVRVVVKPGEEDEVVAETLRWLSGLGAKVYKVEITEPSLEDVFIRLTAKGGG